MRKAWQTANPSARQARRRGDLYPGRGGRSLALNEQDIARERFPEALALFERVHHSEGIVLAHLLSACVTVGAERTRHVAAARAVGQAMNQPGQVARLDRAFG